MPETLGRNEEDPGVNRPEIGWLRGDILTVPAATLLTCLNTHRNWGGAIDMALVTAHGPGFHRVADHEIAILGLTDGDTCFIPSHKNSFTPQRRPVFQAVTFIIDDFQKPLDVIVQAGLWRADQEGCETVSIPLLRTGAAQGRYETAEEAVMALGMGIEAFAAANPTSVKKITIVVFPGSQEEQSLPRHLLS